MVTLTKNDFRHIMLSFLVVTLIKANTQVLMSDIKFHLWYMRELGLVTLL